jgi:hypothetical protein
MDEAVNKATESLEISGANKKKKRDVSSRKNMKRLLSF